MSDVQLHTTSTLLQTHLLQTRHYLINQTHLNHQPEQSRLLTQKNPVMCRSDTSEKATMAENDNMDYPHTEYRNNPQNVLKLRIDMESSAEELLNQVKTIMETLCPFLLPDGEDADIRIKPLTGGLSNHLFLVSNANLPETTTPNAVLVRIHPDGDDPSAENGSTSEEEDFCIVDRAFETKFAAWLASQHEDLPHNKGSMAPTMYGRFENGRVEEFYPNVRPLAWAEMKVYAPWLAQSMASFHTLDPPPEDILRRPPSQADTSSATIYQTMRAWLKQAYSAQLDDDAKELLDELAKEWEWLSNLLAKPPPLKDGDSPIVTEALEFIRRMSITHMDGQPLNILVDLEEDKNDGTTPALKSLRLIDYEYAGWNPIAADIANTFCEYCEMTNLCADYEKEYPSPAQQDEFFWHYLVQSNPTRAQQFSSYASRQEGTSNTSDAEWELFSATLQQEVARFSLLSHLGWSIWSVVKSEEDDGIEWDYLVYARHRMDGYAWAKKKFSIE